MHRGAIRTDADLLLEHFLREQASIETSLRSDCEKSDSSSDSDEGANPLTIDDGVDIGSALDATL